MKVKELITFVTEARTSGSDKVEPHKYSVKLTYRGDDKKWPALKGEIYENDVMIGRFSRAAKQDGFIPPIEYKFLSSQAKNRFDDFADSLSIEETIEALLPNEAFSSEDPMQKARDFKESTVAEASLGARVDYDSYKAWKTDLPSGSTFHKDSHLERAQAIGKDFEGVAGTWNHDKNHGWIYAYYLKKENLSEGWHNHKGGTSLFTADMSDISSHMQDRRSQLRDSSLTCPGCRAKIKLRDFKKNTDRDGDVTDWEMDHSCGAKLRIFND